jgi:hypothetical protein
MVRGNRGQKRRRIRREVEGEVLSG